MMEDFNFDSLKNIDVPDTWVENAINVPLHEDENKPVLFVKFNRTIAMAASLVIICAVSIMVLLTHNDDVVKTIVPTNNSVTQSTANSESTVNKQEEKNNKNTETTNTKETENLVANIAPTQKQTDSKKEPSESKEKPTTPDKAPATQKPTQNSTEATDVEPQLPSDGLDDPMLPGCPPPSDEPETEFEPYGMDTIEIRVTPSALGNSTNVYCMLYDVNGAVVSNAYQYSSQRKCLVTKTKDTAVITYNPMAQGIYYSSGYYSYKFYLSNGTVIANGQTYLQNPYGD